MANDYRQFSVAVGSDLTEVEAKWLVGITEAMNELPDNENENDAKIDDLKSRYGDEIVEIACVVSYDQGRRSCPFDMVVGSHRSNDLWIHADEFGDVEAAAELIHRFFKKFRTTDTCLFSWADTCSSMRLDHFCGGECLITADWIYWPPSCLNAMADVYEKAKLDGKVLTADEALAVVEERVEA